MRSIRNLLCFWCGILCWGISLNAQNAVESVDLVEEHTFTSGIEGPAVDREGNLYAVNYGKEGTIGIVRPDGTHACFVTLPEGSTGNSIRFGKDGDMYVADYTGHNILRVDMRTRKISVFAHEPKMNQPNDIVFAPDGTLYASDPDWPNNKGQLWRVTPDAKVSLLETEMGTTNGIAVSEDGKRFYVNESAQLKVWVYDICPDGTLANKRLFHTFEGYGMDGMKCDEKGNLYVCRYDKGTVALLNPQGELIGEIQLKGKKPSNLTFGGPDRRRGYVTLQDRGCFETFQAAYPGKEW